MNARQVSLTVLFLLAIPGLAGAERMKAKQPNILFIFSDDHAYQAISAYGDPRKLIETPNIDRIAPRGAVRSLRRHELDLRTEPRHGFDRKI